MSVPEYIALFLGTVSFLVALGTWAWKQAFGVAGASFLVSGVALIAFPVFGNIQVKAPGIEISLDQRIEDAFREDPEGTLATIDHSVSLGVDDALDANTTSSSEQRDATRQLLERWRRQNGELGILMDSLHEENMRQIRKIRP